MKALNSFKKVGVVSCLILLVFFSFISGSLGLAIMVELGIIPHHSHDVALGSKISGATKSHHQVKFSLLPTTQKSALVKAANYEGENSFPDELLPKNPLTPSSRPNEDSKRNEDANQLGLQHEELHFGATNAQFEVKSHDAPFLLEASSSSPLTAAAGTIFVSQITDIGSGLKKIVVTTDFDAIKVEIKIGNGTVGYWSWIDITSSEAQLGSYWEYEYVFNATSLAEGYWSVQARAIDSSSTLLYSNPVWFLVDYVPQKILLVDDDENFHGYDYVSYYFQVLESLGYRRVVHFDNYTTSSGGTGPSLSVLQEYELVIWFTGVDYVNTLTSTDRSNLASYLDAGGRLWIIGQDIGFDLLDTSYSSNYDPTFYEQYLKTDSFYWYDVPQIYAGTPYGLPSNGTLVLTGLNSFLGNTWMLKNVDGAVAKYPDEISPINGASAILKYNSTDNPNNGALWYDGTYQLLYLAFNLEAVAMNDLASAVDLANRSLNLFNGGYGKPPTITIQSPLNGSLIPTSSVVLNWTVSDPDSTSHVYRIYVDGRYLGETQSTSYSMSLSDGIHYISVKVIDDTGQEAVDFLVIDVDSRSPTFTQVPSDLQYAEGETFRSAHLLTWNVSDVHPELYEFYKNGTSIDTGSWSEQSWLYTHNASNLPLGTYNFTLKVIDKAGHVSIDTVRVTVYDGTPPIVQGASNISVIEGTVGDTVNWTVFDAHPTTYKIYKEGTVVESGNWTTGLTLNASLDGLSWRSYPYNFTIVVEDIGGNIVKMTTFVSVLDITAPTFNEEPPPTFSYPEGATGNVLSWNVSDLHPSTYAIYRNGNKMSEGTWISNGLITTSIDGLALGTYNFTMEVKDLAGNVNTSTVMVTVFDGTPPEIMASGDLTYNEGTTGNIIYWNVSELHPLNYTVYYVNLTNSVESVWQEGTLNSSYESIVINVDGLSLGKHNFTLLARDQSNNAAISTIIVTVVDATIPTIRLISHVNESIIGLTTILSFNVTDDNALNYTFYRWDDSNVLGGTVIPLNGTKNFLLTITPPPSITVSGWHDLYLFVNDSSVAPQNNNFSIHFRFYIDVNGPIVTGVNPVNRSYLSPNATITFTLTDNASIAFVEYYWNGTQYNDSSPSSTLVIQAPADDGPHELILNIKDSLGNWNNGTRFLYFIDASSPVLHQITFIYSDPPRDDDPTIGIKANISDVQSGVSSVSFEIYVNDSNIPVYNVSASFIDGWWIWIPSTTFQLPAGANLTVIIIARDSVIGTPNKLTTSQWWIIQDHDVTPPTIVAFTYQEGTNVEGKNVTIRVNATDDLRGIKKVIVSYRIAGTGSWTNITASYNASTGYYEVPLPQFTANITLEIKTFVIDRSLNENVAISSIMQVFITDSDFEPPTIFSVVPQPGTNYDNTTLVIIVNVTDAEKGVKEVIVSYKTISDNTWTNVTASNGTIWVATLGNFPVGTKVYLMVHVKDKSLNANQAVLALPNPIIIQESDVYPPVVSIFYNNQTNYEGMSLQVFVNATDVGKGIDQVVVSYKAVNDLSETPWQNMTAYYSPQDGLYVAFLPQFPADTLIHVKTYVKDASSLGNWATSQELVIEIQSSSEGGSQARQSALINSLFSNESLQLVSFEENFTFWFVWGYTAGGKISYLETTNITVDFVMGTLNATNNFIPDTNQEHQSSVMSLDYLGNGNYSVTVMARDLNKVVLLMVNLRKSGFTSLTFVIAMYVVPRAAVIQELSMPSEFRLGEERSIIFGWKDALNGSWVYQNVSVLIYLNDTLITDLASVGIQLNVIEQLIPIPINGWNVSVTLDPSFGWLRGTYNLTIVLLKNGYRTTSHSFILEIKGYEVSLIVTYPDEIITGSEINITVQLALNQENSNLSSSLLLVGSSQPPLSSVSIPSLAGVNVSLAVTLLYLDGTNYTWRSWDLTDASGQATFTIPSSLTRGLFAVAQISVETPGNMLLDVGAAIIPTPPIMVIEGPDESNLQDGILPNLPSQDNSLLPELTELIPLLSMLLLPVVALMLYYLRSSRRKRSKIRSRDQVEVRQSRRVHRRRIRTSSRAMPIDASLDRGTNLTGPMRALGASSLSVSRQEVSRAGLGSVPLIDPIAMERIQDFLKVVGWLLVSPDGTLMEGSVSPSLQLDLNLETIAALHSFSPTSPLTSRGRVETSSAGGFTFVIVTGSLFRLIIIISEEDQAVSSWLSEGMIAALDELESYVNEQASTRQLDPRHVVAQVNAETLILTLESYLPLQLLYPLVLVKAQVVNLDTAVTADNVPRYIIDGWKVLTLTFYLMSQHSPEEVAAILVNGSASSLSRMFKEQIRDSFAPRTTLHELWNILTSNLGFPQKTAAEIIIEGLKLGVIRADLRK